MGGAKVKISMDAEEMQTEGASSSGLGYTLLGLKGVQMLKRGSNAKASHSSYEIRYQPDGWQDHAG